MANNPEIPFPSQHAQQYLVQFLLLIETSTSQGFLYLKFSDWLYAGLNFTLFFLGLCSNIYDPYEAKI